MVNNIGIWKYESNLPDKYKCDMDRIADHITDWIKEEDYTIKTTIENIVEKMFDYFEEACEDTGHEIYLYNEHGQLNIQLFIDIMYDHDIEDYDWIDGQEE